VVMLHKVSGEFLYDLSMDKLLKKML
jgi:hypothetical protein